MFLCIINTAFLFIFLEWDFIASKAVFIPYVCANVGIASIYVFFFLPLLNTPHMFLEDADLTQFVIFLSKIR